MIDPAFSSVDEKLLQLIEDQLTTNEVSSDEELRRRFITTGLTDSQASRAIRYRAHYRHQLYVVGYTPIRKGKHAIQVDPERKQYRLIPC
jgi:hypothetical protein